MGLRINTNIPAINTTRQINRTTSRLSKSFQRLSSGLRINTAADDAAGLAIAEGFRSQILGNRVAQRNSQDGISLVQTAEGVLSETTNILQRIRELAVQSASGTISDVNRAALQQEVGQLIEQLDDIAADTQFNGVTLLTGTPAAITIQSGANFGQQLIVNLTGADSSDLGVNGTFTIGTMANAATAILQIDSAIGTVSSIRAGLGAAQNRLEFTISTLAIQEENAAASESMIRDANVALETIEFTRNQILVNAGIAILAQANMLPQSALRLIAG
jgi:flagellin